MSKIMISQPMNGKTDEEIKIERKRIIDTYLEEDDELINTLFDFNDKNPIYYLSKSIESMSEADIILFAPGWENSRGCKIEFEIAKQYGKHIGILGGEDNE